MPLIPEVTEGYESKTLQSSLKQKKTNKITSKRGLSYIHLYCLYSYILSKYTCTPLLFDQVMVDESSFSRRQRFIMVMAGGLGLGVTIVPSWAWPVKAHAR